LVNLSVLYNREIQITERIMCGSPKPKNPVKGKAMYSGSLLAHLSADARKRSAEWTNNADEKRQE